MLSKNELISFFILLSISSIFSSSAEAIGRIKGTEEYRAPLPHVAQEPVSIAEINDIFSSLDALRTNPHARDAQVPQMATTLKQAFQEQYPQGLLLSYEEGLSDFLRKAEAAGTIPAGSHGAGRLLGDLVKERLKAIPQGSLLHATREILPVCIALSQIARDEQLRTLLDLSVQKDGTNSALYGAFLLHASSALSSLMEERTRQGNAAAEEAAVSSSYLLGAGGGADRRLSEEEELSLALAMSQQDLQKSTHQGNAAAEEAAVSSSYLLGAGGGADGQLLFSPHNHLELEQAILADKKNLDNNRKNEVKYWEKIYPNNYSFTGKLHEDLEGNIKNILQKEFNPDIRTRKRQEILDVLCAVDDGDFRKNGIIRYSNLASIKENTDGSTEVILLS